MHCPTCGCKSCRCCRDCGSVVCTCPRSAKQQIQDLKSKRERLLSEIGQIDKELAELKALFEGV